MDSWRIDGRYIVYPDGTRLPAISGAQEDFSSIIAQHDAGQLVADMQVDYVLNVGTLEYGQGGLDVGGVPYGGSLEAGYTGLSDFLRSGGEAESYIQSVNSGSLSDILRSGGESPGFDSSTFNANIPGVESGWNITSVIDSVTKGITALGGIALGAYSLTKSGDRSGSSSTGSQSQGSTQPSLAQRLFGQAPGAGGNMPQMLMWAAFFVAGGFLIYLFAQKRSA